MGKRQRQKATATKTSAQQPSASSTSSAESRRKPDTFPPSLLRGYCHYQGGAAPEIEALVPNAVFIARHALSSKECRDWIEHAEGQKWTDVNHPASRYIAHRQCGRIHRDDWEMSSRLFRRISTIVDHVAPQLGIFDKSSLHTHQRRAAEGVTLKYMPVSCNPNLRLYKYEKGMWFGRHVDGSDEIDVTPDCPISDVSDAQTEITVLFYLSTCQGGATRFHLPHAGGKRKGRGESSVAFTPEEGAVLLHVHGDRCLEHEAEPVLSGAKYVLRTDIVYGITKTR
ncbi:hypothetical protein THAOC_36389 [Thalassiosira oceanica]|uniref:Fe2OG dioxygenase domain-containing protein n=1 Tax=Thalassiosira oceanica TaxID=159749 RepID=K0R093_THAOC|nr:hypothetical protein THAOC_36389 [Thalassiosira oceanica]|eukprot:EJK45025.1 hypothetical protein THAOC_36389 [Thalassiosira oceanica]